MLLLNSASGLVFADNDNLQNATLITSTPFIDTIDNSAFGLQAGEPYDGGFVGSFWYSYTPPENTNLPYQGTVNWSKQPLKTVEITPERSSECAHSSSHE